MERTTTYENQPAYGRMDFMKRIYWSAVFAGVLVAIVTQMLLTLLGLGIGLSTIDPVTEQNPTAGLGTGSAIWYIVSSLLSLFLGGWIAGRLASAPRLFDGIIHGVLTWSLVTLLTIYFLTTTIGGLIGGAGRLVGSLVSTAGSAVGSAASSAGPGLGSTIKGQLAENGVDTSNLDLNGLKEQVNQLLRETGKPGLQPGALGRQADRAVADARNAAGQAASNPQSADETADGIIDQFIKRGDGVADQIDRNAAVSVVMRRTGKSRADAEQTVDNWVKTYQQARVKFEQTKKDAEAATRRAADGAASAASKAAIFGFLGLLIGVVASGYGAKMGTDSKDDYNAYDRPVREVR